ncbi:molybdopterin-guanine dinucleotide biosynthesis protein MobB [Geobacter sp. DSM 9736]|nr:molybdopterin-guanine dinucleotide biosynthesis protein MobB [Geobacter sp. DSM 9736]
MNVAILVLSDKGARGERVDTSGPALEKWLAEQGAAVLRTEVVPDEASLIAQRLREWSDSGAYDLILTCGGTGVSPRDVTPDATLGVVDRVIPGFGEVMRAKSLTKTPHAMISRAIAGIRGGCLVINLPGSPKGAVENLEAVWPAVPHAVAKIKGDPEDCAGSALVAPEGLKAVSFVAKSGTGKTTLLEKVIAELKKRGWRVGAIKHDAHRFDIDHPGKDSHRLTAAGADTMLISSPEKLALVKRHAASPPIRELIATYFGDVDIVITEGFKLGDLPKIEVHRRERSSELLCRGENYDPTLIAVASDMQLDVDVPLLDLNDPEAVALFVEARFLKR